MRIHRADVLMIAAGIGCAALVAGLHLLTAAAAADLVPWTRELALIRRHEAAATAGLATLALSLGTTGIFRARGGPAAAICGAWALLATTCESAAHPLVRATLIDAGLAARDDWLGAATAHLANAHFSPNAVLAPTCAAVIACLLIRWSDP